MQAIWTRAVLFFAVLCTPVTAANATEAVRLAVTEYGAMLAAWQQRTCGMSLITDLCTKGNSTTLYIQPFVFNPNVHIAQVPITDATMSRAGHSLEQFWGYTFDNVTKMLDNVKEESINMLLSLCAGNDTCADMIGTTDEEVDDFIAGLEEYTNATKALILSSMSEGVLFNNYPSVPFLETFLMNIGIDDQLHGVHKWAENIELRRPGSFNFTTWTQMHAIGDLFDGRTKFIEWMIHVFAINEGTLMDNPIFPNTVPKYPNVMAYYGPDKLNGQYGKPNGFSSPTADQTSGWLSKPQPLPGIQPAKWETPSTGVSDQAVSTDGSCKPGQSNKAAAEALAVVSAACDTYSAFTSLKGVVKGGLKFARNKDLVKKLEEGVEFLVDADQTMAESIVSLCAGNDGACTGTKEFWNNVQTSAEIVDIVASFAAGPVPFGIKLFCLSADSAREAFERSVECCLAACGSTSCQLGEDVCVKQPYNMAC